MELCWPAFSHEFVMLALAPAVIVLYIPLFSPEFTRLRESPTDTAR